MRRPAGAARSAGRQDAGGPAGWKPALRLCAEAELVRKLESMRVAPNTAWELSSHEASSSSTSVPASA